MAQSASLSGVDMMKQYDVHELISKPVMMTRPRHPNSQDFRTMLLLVMRKSPDENKQTPTCLVQQVTKKSVSFSNEIVQIIMYDVIDGDLTDPS